MKRFIIFGIILLLTIPLLSNAQYIAEGTSFTWLGIPLSARASGLGDATVAVTGDPLGVFWNPASIGQMDGWGLGISHTTWYMETQILSLSAVVPITKTTKLYCGINSLNYGDIPQTQYPSLSNPAQEFGTFAPSEIVMKFGFSSNIRENMLFGISGNYYKSDLDGDVNSQFDATLGGIDIGGIITDYDLKWLTADVGFAGLNLTPNVSYSPSENHERIQSSYRIGVALEPKLPESFILDDIMLSSDMYWLYPRTSFPRFNVGLELAKSIAALRVGYFNFSEEEYDRSLSFGLGLNTELMGMNFRLDYSYVPSSYINDIHQISFSVTP